MVITLFLSTTQKELLSNLFPNPQNRPTFLDFAFAQGMKVGLFLQGGTLDGRRVALDTRLSSGQIISLHTAEKMPANLQTRLKKVETPYARAILQAAWKGDIQASLDFNEKKLIRIGKSKFESFLENPHENPKLKGLLKYLSGTQPEIKLFLSQIVSRLGFNSEKELYITFGLLKNDPTFRVKVESEIMANMALTHHEIKGLAANLELIVIDRPRVLKSLLNNIKGHNIHITSVNQKTLPKNAASNIPYALVKLGLTFPKQKNFHEFVKDIYVEAPQATQYVSQKTEIDISFLKSSSQTKSCLDLLAVLASLNANIKSISSKEQGQPPAIVFKVVVQSEPKMPLKQFKKTVMQELGLLDGVKTLMIN